MALLALNKSVESKLGKEPVQWRKTISRVTSVHSRWESTLGWDHGLAKEAGYAQGINRVLLF